MTNSKHIPKRRFPGFEGEWVDFEFKSLLDSYEGIRRGPFGSALKKEFFVPTSEYVVYEQNNAIYNTWDTRYYINYEKFQELEKFKVLPGDFLLSGAGTIGKISQVPKGVKQGVFNQALIRLRINKSFVDENFFLIWIQSDRMQEKLTDANPGSAMTNLVPMSELKKWIVSIPKKEEQVRVSHFIFKINNLITLHQHKLDKLKNLKKAYLAELFPVEGERVPKRRFPDFEGDWERKKVSELFKITRGYVLAATRTESNKSKTTPYPVYSSQTKDKGLMGFYSKYLYEDAITWTTDGANAGEVNFREGKFYCTNVCGVLLSKEVQADPMIAEAINNIAKKYVSYVGNPKLMNNVMADIEISIPQTSSEREKISQFFTDIDKRISLQQEKLDKLKDLKKAYLNELFV